jgi:hypothetical protein
MAQSVGHFAMDSTMLHSESLKLIDRICLAFELAENEDANFAAEVMRVIRAIAIGGRVKVISGGPTAELLRLKFPLEPLLWNVVSIEDLDSTD